MLVMERWVGKVAVVTGASRGIGAAICRLLVDEGLTVVGLARTADKIKESVGETNKKGKLIPMQCDVCKTEDVETVFKRVVNECGGIDICINNAAKTSTSSLLDASPQEWRSILDVNVVALLHCTKLAVQSMKERGTEGQVINISSVSAHLPAIKFSRVHFYAVTKHAVKAISDALRLEMIEQKLNVRVSCVSPGSVQTNFLQEALDMSEEEIKELAAKGVPCLLPENVADAVKYILSTPTEVEANDIILRPKGTEV